MEEELKIKAGTVVHYHGMPFRLKEDARVTGRTENLTLAEKIGGSIGESFAEQLNRVTDAAGKEADALNRAFTVNSPETWWK